MTLFLIGLSLCFFAIILILAFYISYKRQEEKKESEQLNAKYKQAAEVYENEKKQNQNIINNINSDNIANELQELAQKGHNRGAK